MCNFHKTVNASYEHRSSGQMAVEFLFTTKIINPISIALLEKISSPERNKLNWNIGT